MPFNTKTMKNTGKFGRRKSDWFMPIGLALIIGLAMGWVLDIRAKNEEIARLNSSLERALAVSARTQPSSAPTTLPRTEPVTPPQP